MIGRRSFVKTLGTGGVALLAGNIKMSAFSDKIDFTKITILHTNDVHSRIDAFPDDGSRNAGLGGAAKRAALIKKIRKEEDNVLLFDCGDIFQGTPYFNFYGGELEMKLMSEMKYDAATMGNHDFDGGIDGFDKQMVHANFPILVSNYDFSDTVLNEKIEPYKIFEVDGVKVGVFGLGIELEGLVPKELYKNTQYLNPIERAKATSSLLKNELKCDLIVCLSHLGYRYSEEKVSDHILADNIDDIDVILGGHTHTFLKEATIITSSNDKKVLINQAGWAGIMLGRIDIVFERNKKGSCTTCGNIYIG